MLSFPAAINVYLCTVPCDMRRSFEGLSMMAEHVIGCNPYLRDIFERISSHPKNRLGELLPDKWLAARGVANP